MSINPERVTPIFLFSLPRSGSTLVQRVLALQPDIATVAEPWILLPYLYTLKQHGAYAEYAHCLAVRAIEGLCAEFPNGQEDYLQEMGDFVLRLYTKTADYNHNKYFLDKTPRYHLVIEEIMRMFPEGKFIFLWRNPLAVVASMMQTWAEGKWVLYRLNIDLFDGLANLTAAYEKHTGRVFGVRYKDIITNPEYEFERMLDHLALPFNPDSLSDFSEVKFRGLYGDPTGIKQYQSISQAPLDKWKSVLNNPIRQLWCRHYLRWIGRERLAVMGYDLDELLTELQTTPRSLRFVGSDIAQIIYGSMYRLFEPRILKHKLQNAKSWREVNAHT